MRFRSWEWIATLILAWAVLAPLGLLVGKTVDQPDAWRLLIAPEGDTVREAIATSVIVSLATALACTAVAAGLAAWSGRRRFSGRGLAQLAPLLPLSLPPLVGVMSFMFLWGDVGLLAGAWRQFINDTPPPPPNGPVAVWLVHVYSFLPLSFLLMRDGFGQLDQAQEDAARTLGASRGSMLRGVWWPQLRPAAMGSVWISFMASMASFSAPYLLGGSGRYLSTEIVARRMGGELDLAYVETLVLAAISVSLLFFRPTARPSTRPTPPRSSLAERPWLHNTLAFLLVAVMVLPHLTLLLLSFVRDGSWTFQPLPPEYTFANHRGLWDPASWRPLLNSLLMAAPATLVGAIWAWGVGRAEALGPSRGRPWASIIGSLAWAVPATAMGMAWLAAYNDRHVAGFGLVLASTPWLLPWAYAIRFMPMQVRAVTGVLQARGAQLEAAARTLGASPTRAAWQVTFPVVLPALAGASALAFVLAVGEFVVSILLYIPENRPISIEILSELRLFNLGRAAAMGTWIAVLLTSALILIPNAAKSWNDSSSSRSS